MNEHHLAVARVYSRSLLELAEARGTASEILAELGEILAHMERDDDFAAFMTSPLIDAGDRSESLEKLFRGRASDLLVDTLQVMNLKGRLEILPALYAVYRQAHQERIGEIDVQVTTAVPLTDKLRAALRDQMSRQLGKQAHLVEDIDETLIGGMVLHIGDKKVDASVGREIRDLRTLVHQRASHQIHIERLISG